MIEIIDIMREYDTDFSTAMDASKLVRHRYQAFMLGYQACLEDMATENLPTNYDEDSVIDHVEERMRDKHVEAEPPT